MEVLPRTETLEFNPDTLEAVRKIYGLDKPGAMKESIEILDRWIKTQHHFVKKDFSPDYLERMIIASKGSVERAKERLDKLFTLRTLLPKFFQAWDPKCDFENIKGIVSYTILPKMTKDHDRVYMIKTVGKKFSPKIYLEGYRFCLLLSEYFKAHDYAHAVHAVIDFLDAGIPELLAACDLVDLRQAVTCLIDGYGLRLKGIHMMVNSKLVDVVVSIAKQVVSEKIGKRIFIHKSYEELYEYIPREVFPKDYGGGDERTFMEIYNNWRKVFSEEEFKEYLKIMTMARTNEDLRNTDKFNEQYMGMPGTFRSLSVD